MSVSTLPREPRRRASATTARRWQAAAITTAAVAAVVAGCGSSSSTTPASSGSASSGGAGASAVVAAADARLKAAAAGAVTGPSFGSVTAGQIVPWSASLTTAPPPLPTGKQIKVDVVFGIPVGEVPYAAHLLVAMGQKIGWQVKVIQAAAQTQSAALAAMQEAILDKPTAIVGEVTPGVWVGSALAKAKSEGIVTVNLHQDTTTGPGYDAWVPDGEGIQKSLLAAFAISTSQGSAKSLLVDAPGFSDSNIPAAASFLGTCPGCKTSTAQLNPADFVSPVDVGRDVTALLASHSSINYLMWPNGSLPLQPITTAIAQSTDKKVQLLVNDPSPAPLGMVKAGSLPILVESPDALLDLVVIDDISRLVQGQAPVAEDAIRVPISYWTKATAPAGDDFASITAAQLNANDYLTTYEKAWGVSLRSTILGVNS